MIPTRVILHVSDTPDFAEFLPDGTPNRDFDKFGLKDINEWHVAKGWRCCGYHWIIRRTGILEAGRPEDEEGAHCHGRNEDSLGVCYVGRRLPTVAQLNTLEGLYRGIRERHAIVADQWFGHYEYDPNRTCPNISMEVMRRWMKTLP